MSPPAPQYTDEELLGDEAAERANSGAEFRCEECRRRCTRGPSGTEYGHARGTERGAAEPCSRRPDGLDPEKQRRSR